MNNSAAELKAIQELFAEVEQDIKQDEIDSLRELAQAKSLDEFIKIKAREIVSVAYEMLSKLKFVHAQSTFDLTMLALEQPKYASAFALLNGENLNWTEFLLQTTIHIKKLSTTRPDEYFLKPKGAGRPAVAKMYTTQKELKGFKLSAKEEKQFAENKPVKPAFKQAKTTQRVTQLDLFA